MANIVLPSPSVTVAQALPQPYQYRHREAVEPDWTRFPGWRSVTAEQWRDAQWQPRWTTPFRAAWTTASRRLKLRR